MHHLRPQLPRAPHLRQDRRRRHQPPTTSVQQDALSDTQFISLAESSMGRKETAELRASEGWTEVRRSTSPRGAEAELRTLGETRSVYHAGRPRWCLRAHHRLASTQELRSRCELQCLKSSGCRPKHHVGVMDLGGGGDSAAQLWRLNAGTAGLRKHTDCFTIERRTPHSLSPGPAHTQSL